jgi:hypothetical protein
MAKELMLLMEMAQRMCCSVSDFLQTAGSGPHQMMMMPRQRLLVLEEQTLSLRFLVLVLADFR